jgi:hypothetical protein
LGDFSRQPLQALQENLGKGYVGLHVEQGVPVLDRDLNLLQDLITATVRSIVARYLGSGVAADDDAFAVEAVQADNDFRIKGGGGGPGRCLVEGLEVTIEAPLRYREQPEVPALTTPTAAQDNPRADTVFLDAWLVEVDGGEDDDLQNQDDVGLQTSVRLKPTWRVRVAEGTAPPEPEPGHAHYPLARLRRPRGQARIQAAHITDLRQTRLNLAEVETRLRLVELIRLRPAFGPPGDQFTPTVGPPGTEVSMTHRNFDVSGLQVRFGTVLATVTLGPSPTDMRVEVPDDENLRGQVKITVTTDAGSVVSDDDFVVLSGAPVFDPPPNEFDPAFVRPGEPVTLFGRRFDAGGLKVLFTPDFEGSQDIEFDVNSFTATQIEAVPRPADFPGDIMSGTLTVETSAGRATTRNLLGVSDQI